MRTIKTTLLKQFIHTLLLLIPLFGWAQIGSPNFRQVLEEAEKRLASQDYYSAYAFFQQAMRYGRDTLSLHKKMAQAAWQLHAYKRALLHYNTLLASDTTGQESRLMLDIAQAYFKLGYYREAMRYARKFMEMVDSTSEDWSEAQLLVDRASWAVTVAEDSMQYVERLDTTINTPHSDFSPYQHDSVLYYSSMTGQKKKDPYRPPRKLGRLWRYSEGNGKELLPDHLNVAERHAVNASISPDGREMYFTLCDYVGEGGKIRCEIWRSLWHNNLWSAPEKLPTPINLQGYTSTHPFLAYDSIRFREVLYFVSDRPGGQGGMDIWYALRKADGSFDVPVNLESVNTEGDEMSPYYLSTEDILYFSSDGYVQNLGGLDIYRAKGVGLARFDSVANLGKPINSSYDEVYFRMGPDEKYAYFASNREGSMYYDELLEACCFDLYRVHFIPPPIQLKVWALDNYDSSGIGGARFHIVNRTDQWDTTIWLVDTVPVMQTLIEHDKEYTIVVSKRSYSTDTLYLKTINMHKHPFVELRAYLTKYIPLEVTVWDDNTSEPLSNARVQLYEIADGDTLLLHDDSNPTGNTYHYTLIRGHVYKLWGTAPKYDTAEVFIPEEETGKGEPLAKKIGLVRQAIRKLEQILPLVLYFENDEPEPKSMDTTTNKRYRDLFQAFYDRKEEYKREYAKAFPEVERPLREREVEKFFEEELKAGYDKLDYFMEQVLGVLEGGLLLEVTIKGYTSPLANEKYNYRLSKRRVQCLKNEFYTWRNGLLLPWIYKGKLVLYEAPFGESKAPKDVSDSPFERSLSVYSPAASRERRVEVIAVKRLAKAKENVKLK